MQPMPRTGVHCRCLPKSAETRRSRCNGRRHAADVVPSSKEEAVLAVSNGDGDDGMVQASALKAEEAGECSEVLCRLGEGSRLGL